MKLPVSGYSNASGGGLANPDWLLRTGDVIECEIEGIGVLTNAVVDEPVA